MIFYINSYCWTENLNDIRYQEDIVKLLPKSRGTNDRIIKTADIVISSIVISRFCCISNQASQESYS